MLFKGKYRIESSRLKDWDYSSNGYYYVTICVKNRKCIFGEILKDKIILSNIGKIADKYWKEIPKHFPFVKLDEYIIMPNHIHGIIIIDKNQNERQKTKRKFGPQSKNLASIIRGFKAGVKKWATINDIEFYWQPGFYDHIIRDDDDLIRIREYIKYNYLKWNNDEENTCYNHLKNKSND